MTRSEDERKRVVARVALEQGTAWARHIVADIANRYGKHYSPREQKRLWGVVHELSAFEFAREPPVEQPVAPRTRKKRPARRG